MKTLSLDSPHFHLSRSDIFSSASSVPAVEAQSGPGIKRPPPPRALIGFTMESRNSGHLSAFAQNIPQVFFHVYKKQLLFELGL